MTTKTPGPEVMLAIECNPAELYSCGHCGIALGPETSRPAAVYVAEGDRLYCGIDCAKYQEVKIAQRYNRPAPRVYMAIWRKYNRPQQCRLCGAFGPDGLNLFVPNAGQFCGIDCAAEYIAQQFAALSSAAGGQP